jgi:hypothetical protein
MILYLHGPEAVKKLVALTFCVHIALSGCAIRGHGTAANQRSERLAIERGRLSELTDPAGRMQSYIVISDILLTFAADAVRDQDHEAFRELLVEYGRTIGAARDTIMTAERSSRPKPKVYSDLDNALGRQVQTLQNFGVGLEEADHESLDDAIQLATAIRQQIGN